VVVVEIPSSARGIPADRRWGEEVLSLRRSFLRFVCSSMKVSVEKTTPGVVEVSVKSNETFLASLKAHPY
jgi:hypothetical protein